MRAARSAAILCGAVLFGIVLLPVPTLVGTPTPADDVLLSEIGPGFTLTVETPGQLGSLLRTFESEVDRLDLTAFVVTDPPGVGQMFQLFHDSRADWTVIDEPSLDLAAWFVPNGFEHGNGFASLFFATRDHLFWFTLTMDSASNTDPVAFVRELADRQIAAAGGPPSPEQIRRGKKSAADEEIVLLLPDEVPAEYGLASSATAAGNDELKGTDGVQTEVAEFLNKNSISATRIWSDDANELIGAVSLTRFPYDIFAAAALSESARPTKADVVSTDALADVADVVSYTGRGESANQVGTSFRRGDVFVIVLVNHFGEIPADRAEALAADLTRATVSKLPAGGSSAYEFPDTPSTLLALALSAGVVAVATGGSTAIARLRARRARRRWSRDDPSSGTTSSDVVGSDTAIALDRDAALLRRRGAIVAGGQFLAVNVSIVALAGDFAWQWAAAVAVAALAAGLVLTHRWQRRELSMLGAKAPDREFILPRLGGALVGLLSVVVLGLGVGYAVKGLRFLVLRPTLAQLKWSDQLGIAPRTVGVVFAIGGFVVAVLGGWLFRMARALGRSGTKRVLEVDERQAALYLRSFHDDSLMLPTIASARRPLFELFSLRGTDPFEEAVAWELNSYGPVVAVGRPGRSLASLGAAREHLSDETWRDQVASRMDEAGMIAVATGETKGLAWELGEIVAGGHLAKTFFVFPPVAPSDIGRRWEHTAASLVEAGQAVGSLPVPPALVHTVRIAADGTARVTFAHRRDEATYRTAVDQTLAVERVTGIEPA